MIHVIATITALPGSRDAVLELFRKNRPAVLAENGCISYEAVIDVPDLVALPRHTPSLSLASLVTSV